MNEHTIALTLLPSGDFWFDILEDIGNDMGEVIHGFTIAPHEVPAVALTMMEIQLQEQDAMDKRARYWAEMRKTEVTNG